MSRFQFASALAVASFSAMAQPGATPGSAVEYRSAFETFRGWSAEPPRGWREVNDEVRRLGGHAGHLRDGSTAPQSQRPASAKSTEPQASPPGNGQRGSAAAEGRR